MAHYFKCHLRPWVFGLHLREAHHAREYVEPGHRVRPVLRHHDRLAPRRPPGPQLRRHLPVNQLGVPGGGATFVRLFDPPTVAVPAEVTVDRYDVEVLAGKVAVPADIGH